MDAVTESAATQRPAPRTVATVRLTRLLPYLGCSLAVGVFSGFSNFALPLFLPPIIGAFCLFGLICGFALISLIANTRGFIGSIVSPIAGNWSDKVWAGWLGRRRPFILVGGLTSAALMAATPHVARWNLLADTGLSPDTIRVVPVLLVLLTITLTFNMMDDIHKAMLADLTVDPIRSRLSSFSVVTDMGGQVGILVIGFLIGNSLPHMAWDATFTVAAILIAVGITITVLGIREPAPEVWAAERQREAAAAGDGVTWRTLLRLYPGAVTLGLVVFFYWFGVNAVMPLVTLYLKEIIKVTEAEAQLLASLLLLSTTIMAIPMGLLGPRIGKKRVIGFGYVIMAVGALMALVITTAPQAAAVFLMAGIGNAAAMVLTIPLLADLVPRHHMGAATGLLAAVGGIAAPISSLVAGSMANAYGARAIFYVMFFSVVIALFVLTRVRVPPK
jgi:MFS family permease